jgi:hypothetical protein
MISKGWGEGWGGAGEGGGVRYGWWLWSLLIVMDTIGEHFHSIFYSLKLPLKRTVS